MDMTDKKPILKRSTNPSVNTRNRRKYYIELRDSYSDIYDNAKSDSEKAEALESLNATQAKLDRLISNVIARMPKRKPLL
tara:strand:- start:44 stop:283 length:240 start_codon:yes stop_codon:yes gene_type:complete